MLTSLWNLGAFIVALSILIAIHEYGHFWVARRCGVKIHRFSIGFGKVLFKRLDRQGTEFAVAAIPLGGYVKMLDGRVDTLSAADEPFAFDKKSSIGFTKVKCEFDKINDKLINIQSLLKK